MALPHELIRNIGPEAVQNRLSPIREMQLLFLLLVFQAGMP